MNAVSNPSTWQNFCAHFKEAADDNPMYTMPDLAKLGDVGYNLGQAMGCVVAAAAASKPLAEQLNASRFAEHMLSTGNVSGLLFFCRYFGWKVLQNGGIVQIVNAAGASALTAGGTRQIALRTLTLGVGGTAAATAATVLTGAFAAGYVGTLVGCFFYASFRSMGWMSGQPPGWMVDVANRYYGCSPAAERALDERLRIARARSAAARVATLAGTAIPASILRKY